MQPRQSRNLVHPLPLSRTPLPAVDIGGFFHMLQGALALYIQTEGQPENTNPEFIEEFPRERLTKQDETFDIITFRVKSAVPASNTNSGGAPKRPALRESKPSPTLGPDYKEQVYGWWETVRPEFTIWSRNNANANDMTEWFHIFLMKYAFINKYFAGRGIENFVFIERADEDVDHNEGQEIYKRRLTYEFRLNRMLTTQSRSLTNVSVTYGIGNQVDQIELTSNK